MVIASTGMEWLGPGSRLPGNDLQHTPDNLLWSASLLHPDANWSVRLLVFRVQFIC